ncbi:hypothetical protein [Arcobacter sp. LA11]|uniref:hypothetical protein n=1 Tax=Arcobacter sp. LA11 TaxID=1898176 RepID=UPI000933F2D8|nr:hypothetical protein [Arcobacter sp. LA11]
MKILEIRPVNKDDIAVKRNAEVVPKNYFNAIFEYKEKTYTATIRISTNHIAECLNENNQPVRIKEETERKLITAINQYNKKLEK